MTGEISAPPDIETELQRAQAAYLTRCAPGNQTRRIRWSGGETQIIETGRGTPVLLLHGGLGEAFQWGPLLALLARHHRVLAVDRPGHGLADPFDYTGVNLLQHARQFIGEILDAEALDRPPVVASSMGALWAVSFALEYPDRIAQLILPGSPAGLTRALPLQLRLAGFPVLRHVIRRLMRNPTRESVRGFWTQLLVTRADQLQNDFLDLSALSQRRNCPTWFSLMDAAFNMRGLRPELLLTHRWPDLRVPTTLVLGDKDAFGGFEEAKTAAAQNPLIDLVWIADAGHTPWFDQPQAVAEAIEGAIIRHLKPHATAAAPPLR